MLVTVDRKKARASLIFKFFIHSQLVLVKDDSMLIKLPCVCFFLTLGSLKVLEYSIILNNKTTLSLLPRGG